MEPLPLEARYANYVQVGFNEVEFILEFGQLYATEPRPRCHTRIACAPLYAKSLADTLNRSFETYEANHGVIESEGETEEG